MDDTVTSSDAQPGWQFWIDRGGTFTDVVARDPFGAFHVRKLLSEDPARYADAPLHAIRGLLGVAEGEPLPRGSIHSVKMGTTIATNALLERKGAPVGLLTTKGFADLLTIGYQDRPEIFALHITKPEPLATVTIELNERVLADGTVLRALDRDEVLSALGALRARGCTSLAVLFLHSFAYPGHEKAVARLAQGTGFEHIGLSHEVAREIKAVGRGDTTVADAYLTPLLKRYIGQLRPALGEETRLYFMQSNGGLTDAARFSGKNAVLSGPAGGVVGVAHACRLAGIPSAIGFDMGGTSTDVSRYDGTFERVFETRVAGVRLKAPMMHVETVAAGGGSILRFDGYRMVVGPESAGAYPGPACYGKGGPATVTDANLALGRIQPTYFPRCFGAGGNEPLAAAASNERLDALAEAIGECTGKRPSREAAAAGYIRIANEAMAKPIKEISVARGYDVRDYALVCFGGAGAQHACALAEILGIKKILLHPLAGVLSAYGIGMADSIVSAVHPVMRPLTDTTLGDLDAEIARLEDSGARTLAEEDFPTERVSHLRSFDMRYSGADAFLNVPVETGKSLRDSFESSHRARYGFARPDAAVEVVNLRVESIGETEKPKEHTPEVESKRAVVAAIGAATVYFDGEAGPEATETPIYRREALSPGCHVVGPALIVEDVSTIVIDPRWQGETNAYGHLVLTQSAERPREAVGKDCDPVMLEVFNNLFMSIAEQMGETLERVSHSTNIKERLDFSCAVFGAEGDLVANAPHIPVHLGAMGESVKAILEARRGAMKAGDTYLTNDPYHGGSHLPDITVVTPVFLAGDEAPSFFVANRGHHADIGGVSPGSMPPFSKTIGDEGVVLHDVLLVSGGTFHESEIISLLSAPPHPARNLPERLSDLRAQLAANTLGTGLLGGLCERYTPGVVQAYMGHVRANAAAIMRTRIEALPDGTHSAEEFLDSGARIACAIEIDGGTARIDFTGTDGTLPGNLNAPRAVVVAAVLYVFRTLIDVSIPLNAGCLEPITIVIPEGSLLDPSPPAAVVGGNVETSNRVVDVLYKALGAVAASQGTMNNLTFGTDSWGYYETICGGAGAGPAFDGASAVHTHMTNTRITDPEVLETRYPVVLREFSIRRGSGGAGRHKGGDGVVRTIAFREPVHVSILSERRITQPYGLQGGQPGERGRNLLIRSGEAPEPMGGHAEADLFEGDAIKILTPGGGGYGTPGGE